MEVPNHFKEKIEIYELTQREIQIAYLISKGDTWDKISGDLLLSRATVHATTVKLYAKLGVKSKAELVYKLIGLNYAHEENKNRVLSLPKMALAEPVHTSGITPVPFPLGIMTGPS